MLTKWSFALLALIGVAFLGAGCSSSPAGEPGDETGDRSYIEDNTLEAFDRDLRSLSLAIRRSDVDAERSLRTKIGESARMYQKALISALYDDSSTPRRSLAAVMLGFTGDASVVSPLIEKVNDEDEPESVRLNAVLGLATLGDKLRDYDKHSELMRAFSMQMDTKDASFAMRRASILAYSVAYDGAQNDSILPLRDRFLSDSDIRVQIAAINAMGDIGDANAVSDLADVGLGHPDPDIRAASAVALGKIADPTRVLPALVRACQDESATVRRQALDAISKHHGSDPERVYTTVVSGLSDFDSRVREAAALALARFDDPRAIDSLLQATGDRTSVVRQAAAESLGQLISYDREKESFPLVELLTDQNPGVQAAALNSLATVTRNDFGSDQTRWQKYFYTKYPELDPANLYGDGPKPRVSSGISNSSSRRTTSTPSRTTNSRTNSSRTNSSRTNSSRTNSSRTNRTSR